MTVMSAHTSAAERQRVIDEFVDRAFDGIDPQAPGAGIAIGMRQLPAEPDELTPEQQTAWTDLAALVADTSFQRRVREMAVTGASAGDDARPAAYDTTAVLEHAGKAVRDGVAPESAEGRAVLDRIVDPGLPAADRARLIEQIELFTDRRVESYWRLLGVLNGREPFPARVPAFEWLIAALRARS
jgi:hypothetical protein